MARLSLLGLITIVLAGLLVIQATADKPEPNPAPVEHSEHQSEGLASPGKLADRPVSSAAEERSSGEESEPSDHDQAEAEAPASIRRLGKHHSDKSVAGGGVIIGGLVTAIFAAVFCYIRVTRKRNSVL